MRIWKNTCERSRNGRGSRLWLPAILGLGLCFHACGKGGHRLVLSAERAAPIGGEFLRFYADSTAEYGYAVVRENIKAKGAYRYSGDTLYFLSEAFTPHFREGLITIRGDTLYMASGLHFKITKNKLK
jgi:hypothetical protein